MSVKKIVYVTPGEWEKGELTSMAESQIKIINTNVLEWEIKDLQKTFRTAAAELSLTNETLLSLSNQCRKHLRDYSENIHNNFLTNPRDIDAVKNSTRKWEVVVVGVTRKELAIILETLKDDWYDVIDKEEIAHPYDIYTVTIDADKNNKKTNFFKASRGQN